MRDYLRDAPPSARDAHASAHWHKVHVGWARGIGGSYTLDGMNDKNVLACGQQQDAARGASTHRTAWYSRRLRQLTDRPPRGKKRRWHVSMRTFIRMVSKPGRQPVLGASNTTITDGQAPTCANASSSDSARLSTLPLRAWMCQPPSSSLVICTTHVPTAGAGAAHDMRQACVVGLAGVGAFRGRIAWHLAIQQESRMRPSREHDAEVRG